MKPALKAPPFSTGSARTGAKVQTRGTIQARVRVGLKYRLVTPTGTKCLGVFFSLILCFQFNLVIILHYNELLNH